MTRTVSGGKLRSPRLADGFSRGAACASTCRRSPEPIGTIQHSREGSAMPRDGSQPSADGKAIIINPNSPRTVAQEFLDRSYGDDRGRRLLRHRGTFYRWAGAAWSETGEETLRAEISNFLSACSRPA